MSKGLFVFSLFAMWCGAGATSRAQVQQLAAMATVTLSNGDFSSANLSGTGWITQGSVFAPAGVASLGDDTAARAFLYQIEEHCVGVKQRGVEVEANLGGRVTLLNMVENLAKLFVAFADRMRPA